MVADLEGTFITQIGSTGEEGLNDGTFDSASFNRPQVRFRLLHFALCDPLLIFGSNKAQERS